MSLCRKDNGHASEQELGQRQSVPTSRPREVKKNNILRKKTTDKSPQLSGPFS